MLGRRRPSASCLYRAERLGEPRRTPTRLHPIYYLVDAARYGYAGVHETSISLALTVAAAIVVLLVALLHRGWRLKE